jgi:hypothetical protein
MKGRRMNQEGRKAGISDSAQQNASLSLRGPTTDAEKGGLEAAIPS